MDAHRLVQRGGIKVCRSSTLASEGPSQDENDYGLDDGWESMQLGSINNVLPII